MLFKAAFRRMSKAKLAQAEFGGWIGPGFVVLK
jgi:hypothetical protein